MYIDFPEILNAIIAYSKEEAIRLGSYVLTTDHLVLGMIRHSDNAAVARLLELGIVMASAPTGTTAMTSASSPGTNPSI